MTGVAPRSHLEKRAYTRLELKGGSNRLGEALTKEMPYGGSQSATCESEGQSVRENPSPPGEAKLPSERPTDLTEDGLRVGTPCHESDEVAKLCSADSPVPPSILFVASDLEVDDPGKPEPPGEGEGDIFVNEDLNRAIMLPEGLEEDQGYLSLDPPGTSGGSKVKVRGVLFC